MNAEVKSSSPVLAAINAVMHDLALSGIGKDGYNKAQDFHFRGIDAIHNALAPLLVKHGLLIVPSVTERVTEHRERSGKDPLYFVTIKAEYDLISIADRASSVKVGPFYGEAMDSGDKATNKAMSIAYKYFAIQTFCIPLVGSDDPDLGGEVTSFALANDRIVAIEGGFKAAKTKEALRALLEAAHEESKAAGDSYAHKRFTETASACAAKIVGEPQSKSGKDQPAPQGGNDAAGTASAPARSGADPSAPKASASLISMIKKTIAAKKVDAEALADLTGGEVIEQMSKPDAAALLTKLNDLVSA